MSRKYKEISIKATLPRKDAETLMKLLAGKPEFQKIVSDILYWLKPVHVFKLPCVGCGTICEWGSHEPMTKKQAIERWGDHTLCESCVASEDFK